MIREMGNVESFELCETIPKVQCSECLLFRNKELSIALADISCESSQHFHQWRLDALSIPHFVIRKGRPRGARHGKTEVHFQHFLAHNARRRCLQLKLAGPRTSASQWINWHRKTTPTARPLRSMRDTRKTGVCHWTNRAEMHRWNSDQISEQQSQLWTVSTTNLEKSDLNQSLFINTKSGIRLLLLPVPHGGSGMKPGGARFFFFFKKK